MNNRRILIANVAPPELDKRRVLIANLAKGQIGEQASNLLGSLLISHLQLVTMARSEMAPEKRAPFFVGGGRISNFATDAFASLLSEARKFGTHFCLAAQYLHQLAPTFAQRCSETPAHSWSSACRQRMPKFSRRSSIRFRRPSWRDSRRFRLGCAAATWTNVRFFCIHRCTARAIDASTSLRRAAATSPVRGQ